MKIYVGIDPGASGGLAAVDGDGTPVAFAKMPETDAETLRFLTDLSGDSIAAVIERVWSSPQMGVASAFKFGVNVGMLKMALAAARIPYDEVVPSKWQQALGCRVGTSRAAGGEGGDKNITKRRAAALFPNVKMTHAIADALLIAEFCRRVRTSVAPSDHQPPTTDLPLLETRF